MGLTVLLLLTIRPRNHPVGDSNVLGPIGPFVRAT
jgi:hypothetical protein